MLHMRKRENMKTTINQAVEYWMQYVDECELSVDWAEADQLCWRCGCKHNLQRAHIIPDSLGGKDTPDNIVLLCDRCHKEAPNVTDPEIMWDWIKAYSVPFYNTFWTILARREYEFIYGKSYIQELMDICEVAHVSTEDEKMKVLMKDILENTYKEAGIHYGQPYFNTATLAGIYRMTLKKLAAVLEVDFPLKEDESDKKRETWWFR